jgi:hypothetical protein
MKGLSTLNSMAFGLAVYGLQYGLPTSHANSLPAGGQTLLDGFSNLRVPTTVPGCLQYLIPLSQARLAQADRPKRRTVALRVGIIDRRHSGVSVGWA